MISCVCGMEAWTVGSTVCAVCNGGQEMKHDDRYVAQEGGDHYQVDYQHWDWVTDIHMGYLPGNATKYVSRWRKKNGVADLRKAMTYLDKMILIKEADSEYVFNDPNIGYTVRVCTDRFIQAAGLTGAERSIIEILSGPCTTAMLVLAKDHVRGLLRAGCHNATNHTILDQNRTSDGRAGGMVGQGAASSTSTEPPGVNHPAPFGYEGDE